MLTFAVLKLHKMEKEFIPYDLALELKELGFDEPCLAQYKKYDVGKATLDIGFSKNEIIMQFHKLSKFCSAPTFSQAFRFFREKYDLHPSIESYNQDENGNDIEYTYTYCVVTNKNLPKEWNKFYNTYEEAEFECLKKLIEIVKEK